MFALRLARRGSLAAMLAALPRRGRFCLDGLRGHPEGRWTFLGAEPEETIEVRWGQPLLDALGTLDGSTAQDFELDELGLAPDDIPGWVGFIAYDAAWSEPEAFGLRTPPRLIRDPHWPVMWLARYESMIAIDLDEDAVWALGRSRQACQALSRMVAGATVETPGPGASRVDAEDRRMHRDRIEHALGAIAAGDVYQVNLARAWRADLAGSPLAVWQAMREASPVPLGAYVETEAGAVVCRSMERFVRWDRRNRRLRTSPIKGTIARSGADDLGEAARLSRDDKERAEHTMIVDLMRNDLSRIAEVGSVKVVAPLRVEPFAALSHLVSTVECRTRPETTLQEIIAATFPPGSVTGTPKLAAMELIEAQEALSRGVYTGAIGYIDRGGGLSLAVAIRTALIDHQVTYYAGGGLVSASEVDREIAETELKAKVFFDAMRVGCESSSGAS